MCCADKLSVNRQLIFILSPCLSRYDEGAYHYYSHRNRGHAMSDWLSLLPSMVLFAMIALTLALLPLLDDERTPSTERQQTDQIRLPRRPQ